MAIMQQYNDLTEDQVLSVGRSVIVNTEGFVELERWFYLLHWPRVIGCTLVLFKALLLLLEISYGNNSCGTVTVNFLHCFSMWYAHAETMI